MLSDWLRMAWTGALATVGYLLTAIGLLQVIAFILGRTVAGRRYKLRRAIVELARDNADLFRTEHGCSIPAFLRTGPHHEKGVMVANWYSHAFSELPLIPSKRDDLEFIALLSWSRQFIEKTLSSPSSDDTDEKRAKIYEQLYPRFNRICDELKAIGKKAGVRALIQLRQEYLPAPNTAREPADALR